MTHLFEENELGTTLLIDETLGENTQIHISDSDEMKDCTHYLTPKELNDFISILLHIQSKKRKQFNTKF
jgi:hypothetical protein